MRMKNELRAVAGAAVAALLIAGCGSSPVPPVMAHGVAAREPLAGCTLPAAAALSAMTSRLEPGSSGTLTVSVAFPKVNLATQVSMRSLLIQLGMGVAFTEAADFSGLSTQACCIGLVEHAATLDVGEKGTVASAATAVGMEPTAARVQPPQVLFNRPYLIVVTDRPTGEPLFMARVTNPTTH
jgi:serpin B